MLKTLRMRARWALIGGAAVATGAGGLLATDDAVDDADADTVGSAFVAVEPVRILDSRTDVGLVGPLTHATSQTLTVTGDIETVGVDRASLIAEVVPESATAIVANVTGIRPTAPGFISVRPGDAADSPTTSTLNFNVDLGDVANAVTVGLADDGTIELHYHGAVAATAEITLDVVGYYTPLE